MWAMFSKLTFLQGIFIHTNNLFSQLFWISYNHYQNTRSFLVLCGCVFIAEPFFLQTTFICTNNLLSQLFGIIPCSYNHYNYVMSFPSSIPTITLNTGPHLLAEILTVSTNKAQTTPVHELFASVCFDINLERQSKNI